MYKYIFSLICLLGVALGTSAQGYRYQNVIQGPRGPLANVPVAVCSQPATISSAPCSPLATLYTDSTDTVACNGTNGCSNPLTSDGYGNVLFYAAPGKYTIQYYGPQFSAPVAYQDIVLPCDPSNCSLTGTVTLPGLILNGSTITASEPVVVPLLNNVIYADQQVGSDIGAKVNAAYAACPTPGTAGRTVCKIILPQSSNGSCYVVTTPIVFGTNGKPMDIDFGGSCLDYSGLTSGNAITVDVGQGFGQQWRMSNLKLLGPCATTSCVGATTVGIQLGSTNGAVGGTMTNVQVGGPSTPHGFAIGMAGGSNAWFNWCINCQIDSNAIGLKLTSGEESTGFLGGAIAQNAVGLDTSGSGAPVDFIGTSFDDNSTTAYNRESSTTFPVRFVSCHFENAGLGLLSVIVDNASQGTITYSGGDAQDDSTTGSVASLFTMAATNSSASATLKTDGFKVLSQGQTITEVAALGNGTYDMDFILEGTLPSAIYNSNLTGAFRACSASGSNSFRNCISGGGFTVDFSQNNSPGNPPSGADRLNFDTSDIFGPLTSTGVSTRSKWSGLIATGTATLTGTGACATNSTQKGGAWAGQATCTGTTGASTFIITPGTTAPNGWSCTASDLTTAANILRQSVSSTTACTIAGTVNANDVLTFTAVAY